eukprot:TRINITY_DN71536_c0_g1_i1.p1 TRINITY_DN71536_c0_g1~~TRINITY_DN71536_c0_g1_i1.p1  ORF type:complete len:185 (-),score=34.57 TRINITY_DN71536_c0_g1_i1:13-567(-)
MGGPGLVDGEERDEFANFLPCSITKDGITYPSAEHFFQAHKTTDLVERQAIASASFDSVYSCGRTVKLRPDWERVKLKVMLEAAEMKYAQNDGLREALLSTQGPITFTPSAGFWGVDERSGQGENWNGRIHAAVRAKLRGDEEQYLQICADIEERCCGLGSARDSGVAGTLRGARSAGSTSQAA